MNELEKLNFTLDKKMKELENLRADLFILNPEINKLCAEIKDIQEQIDELKKQEDN